MTKDVFISYASEDREIAEKICAGLESIGISCWIAPRDILPGDTYSKAIMDGLDKSRVFVLVFSEYANKSPHILREVGRSVNNNAYIIPFIIDKVKPNSNFEYFIGPAQRLDATAPPLENHIERLVSAINVHLKGKEVPISPHIPEPTPLTPPTPKPTPPTPPTPKPTPPTPHLPKKSTTLFIVIGVIVFGLILGMFLYYNTITGTQSQKIYDNQKDIQLVGDIYGFKSPGSNGIDKLTFTIKGKNGGQSIDLSQLGIDIVSPDGSDTTNYIGHTNIDPANILYTSSDGSNTLSTSNTAEIVVLLNKPMLPNKNYGMYIFPESGSGTLDIRFSLPAALESANILFNS
jgi:hypothetical protein